ncbi:VWA domain-containing protein [Alphaproteobacteria bacterium]|nr:VWA domain-containing protein [Alphaproteobacteria bacterium]
MNNSLLPKINNSHFIKNIIYFARILRKAGFNIGTREILLSIDSIRIINISNKEDFFWALHSVFVNKKADSYIFKLAFEIFWKKSIINLPQNNSLINNAINSNEVENYNQRIAHAFFNNSGEEKKTNEIKEKSLNYTLTHSNKEKLKKIDFETMNKEELDSAKKAINSFNLSFTKITTRRFKKSKTGKYIDINTTIKSATKNLNSGILLNYKSKIRTPPPLVVICDISGSMSKYSRMFMHFMHAISNKKSKVFTFVFGTRLTNITHNLKHSDVDLALDKVSKQVKDWSGGTRMNSCMHEFNIKWAKRVLSHGSIVLMMSDGLDRENNLNLGKEIKRIKDSCRHLIWLNPLLRYEKYEPIASGAASIYPYVDELKTIHNIDSMAELCKVLSSKLNKNYHYGNLNE